MAFHLSHGYFSQSKHELRQNQELPSQSSIKFDSNENKQQDSLYCMKSFKMVWFKTEIKALALAAMLVLHAEAGCPFLGGSGLQDASITARFNDEGSAGDGGIPDGGYESVKNDLKDMFTNSQNFWPADFGHYGPFMIRLAWHCAGSYRSSDGRGGCDGGRIRFDPELSWPDNANLNMALKLLEPIKKTYGCKLSWGDLIVLAGTTAIESMGGPVLGFCGGRMDDGNGDDSLRLGPSKEQEEIAPCEVNGECKSPLGPTTVGLIYVNPEGHLGEPVPEGSAVDIRDSFQRMDMNDTETVALVGGGHAFGKMHGACSVQPCGNGTEFEGKGANTVTSGFEGVWTTRPTQWTNEYFSNLLQYTWDLNMSPAGNFQWTPLEDDAPDIVMLTSDLALTSDPLYKEIVEEWSVDIKPLEHHFEHAWYKLMTRDMGPVTRCLGDDIPPPQSFQMPLPETPADLPDYVPVRAKIQELLDANSELTAQFVNLAFQCASTYRDTDHLGGCNGARIRFSPESEWPSNAGTQETLKILGEVKDFFREVSWADLIVLAGQTAIEDAGGVPMAFCGGRVDAENGMGSELLAPRTYTPATVSVIDDMQVKGLSPREYVALAGRPASAEPLSNEFFTRLLDAEFDDVESATNNQESNIERSDPQLIFTAEQIALTEAPHFKVIVEEYASDEEMFKQEFSKAWMKMMTADRFSGPFTNLCEERDDKTLMSVAEDKNLPQLQDKSGAVSMSPSSLLFVTIFGVVATLFV